MPSIVSAGIRERDRDERRTDAGAPSRRQSGIPARLAALSTRCGLRFGLVEKLKIPWPAGLRPVRNDDHAVGVTAGIVERSGPKAPRPASDARVGSRSCASRSQTRSWSAPSSPRQRIRLMRSPSGRTGEQFKVERLELLPGIAEPLAHDPLVSLDRSAASGRGSRAARRAPRPPRPRPGTRPGRHPLRARSTRRSTTSARRRRARSTPSPRAARPVSSPSRRS